MHVKLIEEVAPKSLHDLYYLRNLSLQGFRVLQLPPMCHVYVLAQSVNTTRRELSCAGYFRLFNWEGLFFMGEEQYSLVIHMCHV